MVMMEISRNNSSSPKNNTITDGRALTRCPRFRITKCVKFVETMQQNHVKITTRNTVDDNEGAVRVKLVLSKKQLRQMMNNMNQGKCSVASTNQQLNAALTTAELEHVLNALLKMRMKKAETDKEAEMEHSETKLHSIAEEMN